MAQDSGVTPERIYRARAVIRFGLPLLTLTAIIASAWLAGRDSAPGTEPWLTTAFIACGVAAVAVGYMAAHALGRRLEVYEDWFRYRILTRVIAARWHQVEAFYTATAGIDPSSRRRLAGRYEFGIIVGGRRLDLGTAIGADAALGVVIAPLPGSALEGPCRSASSSLNRTASLLSPLERAPFLSPNSKTKNSNSAATSSVQSTASGR